MSGDNEAELRKELDAVVQARRELGPEYDSALVDSFLEKLGPKVDREVELRVRRQLAEQSMAAHRPAAPKGRPAHTGRAFGALPYVSMVFAVPLSAVGVVNAGLSGLLVSWAGIVGVNVAHAWFQGGGVRDRRTHEDRWED